MMGRTVVLNAVRETDHGMYLTDGSVEILLPRREVTKNVAIGTSVEAFVYRDSEDRPTATLVKPLAEVDQAASMNIVDVSEFGAFARWGLSKDLLIPWSEQAVRLSVGQTAIVLVALDEATDRLYGTTKIQSRLKKDVERFDIGQELEALVWRPHPKGWIVLVEHRYQGMIYANEHPGELTVGTKLKAWVVQKRDDGKLDVRTRPQGFSAANPDAREKILHALRENGGSLPLGDKSDPQAIQRTLGISKKAFKTACGTLFKERAIVLEDDRISLLP